MGLNPRTPGSQPKPKADAQLLSHPGIPSTSFIVEETEAHGEKVIQPRGAWSKDEGSLPLLLTEEKRKCYL